jgi:hypothetical protein
MAIALNSELSESYESLELDEIESQQIYHNENNNHCYRPHSIMASNRTDTNIISRTRERKARVEFIELSDVECGKQSNDDYNHHQRRESDIIRFFRSRSRSRSPSLTSFATCKRSQQQRMSLLGRPINYKPFKQRDPRYRIIQSHLHNFLERPRGFRAISYHLLL